MAHRVCYRATHVHLIVSTVIEINVRRTGGPAQHERRSFRVPPPSFE